MSTLSVNEITSQTGNTITVPSVIDFVVIFDSGICLS